MAKQFKVISKNKDAVVIESSNGKKVTLLSPTGKCKRYQREINAGQNHRGEILNDVQIGYRMGYRAALGEQAKIYKKKKG